MADMHCNDTKCPYIELMLRELDGFSKKQDAMNSTLAAMSTDIALLKYKSGIFGAIAGLVPGVISSLAMYLNTIPK